MTILPTSQRQRMIRMWRCLLVAASLIFHCQILPAAEPGGYTGDDGCYKCHKLIKIKGYRNSTHGKLFTDNPRTELEARGCEACHGPGARHSEVAGSEDDAPMELGSFKPAPNNTDWINRMCQACHQGGLHTEFWAGGAHQMNGLSCASCHRLHGDSEQVPQRVCETCHAKQRAKMNHSPHLPPREAQMGCKSCHNAHGGAGDASLNTATANDVCYQCHAGKRGPFIWEHAPVRDNCSNCHDAHGSNHPAMLKMRPPYLCQGCHQATTHVSALAEGSGLNAGNRNKNLVGGSCMNCHTLIHGSNHPSGGVFQR